MGQGAAMRLHYCFLAASPLSLQPLPSLISSCSNLPFVTQGKLWRLESVPYKQETGDTERFPTQDPHRVLLSFSLSYAVSANYSTSEDWGLQGSLKPGARFSDLSLLQLCGRGIAYPFGPLLPLLGFMNLLNLSSYLSYSF